jgi:hypothetical protein
MKTLISAAVFGLALAGTAMILLLGAARPDIDQANADEPFAHAQPARGGCDIGLDCLRM